MNDPTKSYYLRLTAEMNRELRHRCVETGATMNATIITAIRKYLDTEGARVAPAGEEQSQP